MDKPLRHEDYLTMAEENRRLRQEIKDLVTPKEPVTFLYDIGVWAPVIIYAFLLIVLLVSR